MKNSFNPNKAKIHRSYVVEEVADLFGVHKNTVRSWVKAGLSVCDDRKPILILGGSLRAFMQERKSKHKQKCQPWEMYCVRCRKPQTPAGLMADYEVQTETRGRLIGICPVCEGGINKFAQLTAVEALMEKLDISFAVSTKPHKQDE
ncbi:MAG: helix-turn-helix domain-containing protein [Cycloclasticus sp.]